MGKSSGGTRASSAGSPKGLSGGANWNITTDSWGSPAIKASGAKAEELYTALSSPVERAVRSQVGDIRSGGGFTGEPGARTYTVIFRDGTSNDQIQNYIKLMTEGSKLYANYLDRDVSREEHMKAEDVLDKWLRKTSKER